MADYTKSGVDLVVALVSDPPLFAQYFVDFIDKQTNLGAMEPIADMAKPIVAEQLVRFLGEIPEALSQVQVTLEE